jgi:hypothetical protein
MVELRAVAAAVLAVATDALLEAHHLPITWCQSGYRTGPPACAQSRAKKQPRGGEHAEEKGREEKQKRAECIPNGYSK